MMLCYVKLFVMSKSNFLLPYREDQIDVQQFHYNRIWWLSLHTLISDVTEARRTGRTLQV